MLASFDREAIERRLTVLRKFRSFCPVFLQERWDLTIGFDANIYPGLKRNRLQQKTFKFKLLSENSRVLKGTGKLISWHSALCHGKGIKINVPRPAKDQAYE